MQRNDAVQSNAKYVELDPYKVPLDQIDVSDPALHQADVVMEFFRRLRKEDPVHYCENGSYGPFWSITKFDDIVHCDTSHRLFSSEGGILIDDLSNGGGPDGSVPMASFIAMDQPRHDEHRKAITPAVAPANLRKFEQTMRERTQHTLDNLPIGEEFDWVSTVSVELTSQMLATLMGAPQEDRAQLIRWSDVTTSTPGEGIVDSWEQKSRELIECAAYFRRLFDRRKNEPPAPDVISIMALSQVMDGISPEEFLATVRLLIVGGNDTTRNSMSGSVLALDRHPDQWIKLKENPALVASMVPEIIRWQTPVPYQGRRALEDTEVGGKLIRKGDRIAMWYLSGNRDDSVIDRPDELIIDRANPRHHLSFGFGIHRCVGNRLAEMQLRVLWEEILKKDFKKIEVTGEPQRVRSNVIRGISHLPVRISA